jgi:putative salt-induced outer membrane protein
MNKNILLALAALAAFSAHAQEAPPPGETEEAAPAETEEAESAPAQGEAAAVEMPPPTAEEEAAAEKQGLTPAELQELAPVRGEFAGHIEAGFLSTDGNSTTHSVNGKVHTEYKRERWKNTTDANGVSTSGTTGTTAERYLAGDKVDYLFYEKNYAFVQVEWEKDLFGGIRERTSETAGVGRHFLAGPAHLLDGEVGAGARQTEQNVTGLRQNEAIGRVTGRYEWKFTDKNSFSEAVKAEGGETNIYSESVTQLKLAIVGNLSSAMSYTVRQNSKVPAGREHTDTEAAVNLVYDFGKK